MDKIAIEVSSGELLDKISILMIKSERMSEPHKLQNVRKELDYLNQVTKKGLPLNKIDHLFKELRAVNEDLWEIEDQIREHEKNKCFDQNFILLARSVYMKNDLRALLKSKINDELGSNFREEKSYTSYSSIQKISPIEEPKSYN